MNLEKKVDSRTRELKKAKEKAEESNRLKTAFLQNLSHEVRTPMNGIIGFSNLLSEHGLLEEQKEHYIEIIKKSGQRMLNTINNIVEIAKIETEIIGVNLALLDVNKCIENIIEFFQNEVNEKNIRLEFVQKLPEGKSVIQTDRTKLESVLTNIIGNAVKFTFEGSISVGCERKNDVFEIYIKDTGIGIQKNRLQTIFNRFEKLDNFYEGTGLGLAISKSYIEMLGGEILVKSNELEGSVFFIKVPCPTKADE